MENIKFIDEKERELFARAQLGEQAREFLLSPIGRYLHGRAQADVEAAQVEALECDPDSWWGRKKLRKLRERSDTARNFMRYLADAITDGDTSFNELSQYRSTEK